MHILVVDDDDDFAISLAAVLELDGHRVDIVNNADAALTQLRQTGFDLVVLDIMMPGVDGVETLRRTRVIDPKMPVIMMSGYSDNRMMEKARAYGATEVLRKPLDLDLMLGRLEELAAR